jgi:hypothetical protein
VTSMALIAGLEAADAGKAGVISGLLIAAVADNLSDLLSVQMYQESERLEQKDAFIGTVANFATRFVVCVSFVLIVRLLPKQLATVWEVAWGLLLLTTLTYILAGYRKVSAVSEIIKHVGVAVAIIMVGQRVGHWIAGHVMS